MSSVLLVCTNRGCLRSDYHKLDTASDEVVCIECGENVSNITSYMKKTLKNLRQVFTKTRSGSELKCKSCGYTGDPVLMEYSDGKYDVACSRCSAVDPYLSKYFVEALKAKEEIVRVKAPSGAVSTKSVKRVGITPTPKTEETAVEEPSKAPKAKKKSPRKVKSAGDFLKNSGFKELSSEISDEPSPPRSFKKAPLEII